MEEAKNKVRKIDLNDQLTKQIIKALGGKGVRLVLNGCYEVGYSESMSEQVARLSEAEAMQELEQQGNIITVSGSYLTPYDGYYTAKVIFDTYRRRVELRTERTK